MAKAESSLLASTVTAPGNSSEVVVRTDGLSLCLMLNRRTRVMRVIDFRAGASLAKKSAVHAVATREQIEKVIVVVERDECAAWGKLGLLREGNIPSFYRRTDAFIMGYVVSAGVAPPKSTKPARWERMPPLRGVDSGVFTIPPEVVDPSDPESDDDDDAELKSPISTLAEKTTATARRLARELADAHLPTVKLTSLDATQLPKRLGAANKEGRALTGFEPFGRGVERADLVASSRSYGDVVIGAEIQRCYGNAFLEVLTSPRDDRDRALLVASLRAVCDHHAQNEIVSVFAMVSDRDVRLATAFAAAGFRRTGVLRRHFRHRHERSDALLWTRKLADT